jgi:hypothetical protein
MNCGDATWFIPMVGMITELWLAMYLRPDRSLFEARAMGRRGSLKSRNPPE